MSTAIQKRGPVEVAPAQPAAMSPVYLGSIAVPAHEVLDLGRKIATALADIISAKQLFKDIQGKKYVYVDAWTTMGAMLGVVPREVSSVEIEPGVYEGIVELVRTSDGAVVGRASSICGSEATWKNRDKYARKSMATTRAAGKAFRLAYSWIMVLANYEPTPAEEMPHGWGDSGSKEAQADARDRKLAELHDALADEMPPDGPASDIREDPIPEATPTPSVAPGATGSRPTDPRLATVVVPRITKKRMAQFQEAKACFRKYKGHEEGTALYYRFLKPYPKSNHVPDDKTAMQLLAEMGKMKKALELEAAEAEMNAASLICHLPQSGCSIPIANAIAAAVKKSRIPLDEANKGLRQSFDDYQAKFPEATSEQAWTRILLILQDALGEAK